MALNFKCPTCVSLTLISTVNIKSIEKDVVTAVAFFKTDGSLQKPVIKQRVTTLCSLGHEVVNEFAKLPDEIVDNIDYFIG